MIFASCRRSSILLLSLCAFLLAACEPVPNGAVNIQSLGSERTNEESFGPNATAAEITRQISGNSYTSAASSWHFGSDGKLSVFSTTGCGRFSIGTWRAENSSGEGILLMVETEYRGLSGTFASNEVERSRKVYILDNGDVELEIVPEVVLGAGTLSLKYTGRGFSRESTFNSVREGVLAGEFCDEKEIDESEPSAGALIGEGAILLLLCAGSAMILCPI